MWKEIDLVPMDIHIRPQQKFKLGKKYDVILVTMSNIFWQSDRIVNFSQGSVSQNWETVDGKTGAQSTFFMPYMLKDIKFFITQTSPSFKICFSNSFGAFCSSMLNRSIL